MIDIYTATQTLLEAIVLVGTNVSAYVLKYDTEKDQFILPDFPAVTYNYANMTPLVSFSGTSNLYRVELDVEVWGDLGQIDENAKMIESMLNGQRVTVENVLFTIVMMESQDIAELGLDFKRRRMRFTGIVDVDNAAEDISN